MSNGVCSRCGMMKDKGDPCESVQCAAQNAVDMAPDKGLISDGYHTFDELYEHRHTLFICLCKSAINDGYSAQVWRSKYHSDGTSIDGWFIVGIGRKHGEQITYHFPMSKWEECGFLRELDRAPEWDGHASAEVLARLRSLYA